MGITWLRQLSPTPANLYAFLSICVFLQSSSIRLQSALERLYAEASRRLGKSRLPLLTRLLPRTRSMSAHLRRTGCEVPIVGHTYHLRALNLRLPRPPPLRALVYRRAMQ